MEKKEQAKKAKTSKLRMEESTKEQYGKKLRHKKADNKLTDKEIAKSKQLMKQSYKAARAVIADSTKLAQKAQGSDEQNDNCDTAEEVISETGHVVGGAVSTVAKKVQKAHYSKKIHTKTGKTNTETSKSASKELMKKQMQRKAAEKQRKTAENTGKIGRKLTDKAEDVVGKIGEFVVEFVKDNPVISFIIVVVLLLLLVCSGTFTACGAMAGGGEDITLATSYTAHDQDILDVDADYTELEEGIQDQIDDIENNYPDYDEYNYYLDEIGHNPFKLAALLTVLYEDYTREEVQGMLQTILDLQYELSIEEVVETRSREVERSGVRWVSDSSHEDGGYWESYTYTETEYYQYYILNVTLTNHSLDEVVNEIGLTEDQLERYQVLLLTYGNKRYLFEDDIYSNPSPERQEYEDYNVPGEYLTDEEFARMLQEAERHLGLPYVWGGYDPNSGFDCSGFVSWVINHCGNGWNYGRLTANGLKNVTARVPESEVKPGDLVFFQGTYNTSGASHVGIVVDPVNKIMIHCGNPIHYASYDTPYWRAHAYCYGRLP